MHIYVKNRKNYARLYAAQLLNYYFITVQLQLLFLSLYALYTPSARRPGKQPPNAFWCILRENFSWCKTHKRLFTTAAERQT